MSLASNTTKNEWYHKNDISNVVAFQEGVLRLLTLFYKYITRFKLDPDDIIHDCVLKILSSKTEIYELYNGQRINYLTRLVRNCCINSQQREQRYTELNGYDIIEDQVEYSDALDVLNNSHLSKIKKQVIYGHFWKDLTYTQMSKDMNVSDNTLKSAFYRSKEELKEIFQ